MNVIAGIVIAGVIGGVVLAILWVAFFTIVMPWPAHSSFTPMVFVIGGSGSALIGLKALIR